MRLAFMLAGLAFLAACVDATHDASAKAALLAANRAYDKALIEGDAEALSRFYTDDFQIIDDDAQIHGKEEQIRFMTREVDLLHARTDDVRLTMLADDAALLTGRFIGRYRMNGKEADFVERYTSVWVRSGKDWRLKHEHSSMMPPAM